MTGISVNDLVRVFVEYSVEAAAVCGMLYYLTWRVLRSKKPFLQDLETRWHFGAFVGTCLIAGAARIATALLLGGTMMERLWNNQGIGLIGPVLIPIIIVLCWFRWFQTRARNRTSTAV